MPLASSQVAVIALVVPDAVVETAVDGVTVTDAARPGTTVVGVVNVTRLVPINFAVPPAAGVMYTVIVAVPAPVLGARRVTVEAVAVMLAAAVDAVVIVTGDEGVPSDRPLVKSVPAAVPPEPTKTPLLVDTEIVSPSTDEAAGVIDTTVVLRPSPGMDVGTAAKVSDVTGAAMAPELSVCVRVVTETATVPLTSGNRAMASAVDAMSIMSPSARPVVMFTVNVI